MVQLPLSVTGALYFHVRLTGSSSNASYIAKLKMKAGIDYEQRHVWSILQDIADLDQNSTLNHSTILHDAALQYTDMTLREVLSKGAANIDDVDGLGFTALHWSAMREDLPSVKVLLKTGADVNVPTAIQKWSALHLACMRSSCDISAALIEAGARLDHEDHKGQTPFHYVPFKNSDLVKLLLDHGADAKHEDYHGSSVLHNMARRKPPYQPRTRRREEPQKGVDTMSYFHSRAIKMDIRNARGETPTMLLAMNNTSVLSEMFAVDLLSFKEPFPDSDWNILHYAAYYWDYHSLARLSFEDEPYQGPPMFDPDAPDHEGIAPLEALEYRMFVPEEEREPGVYRPTRREVKKFVAKLRDCRHANWNGGYYLDTKQRFLEDGSHEKMEAWLAAQDELTTEDELQLWQNTDPWWRDIKRPDDSDSLPR